MEFANIVTRTASKICEHKNSIVGDRPMTVSIEGLSNSGKSTFSESVCDKLNTFAFPSVSIEGDAFHVGYTPAMKVYNELIDSIEKGNPVDIGFYKHVWRFGEMESQLISQISSFDFSSSESNKLVLENILDNKQDGTEHSASYDIKESSVILVPSIYLRHLPFDYSIFLDVSPKVSTERKIERAKRDGKPRDPKVTERMVSQIEYPAMLAYAEKVKKPDLVIDMNDFNNMEFKEFLENEN